MFSNCKYRENNKGKNYIGVKEIYISNFKKIELSRLEMIKH